MASNQLVTSCLKLQEALHLSKGEVTRSVASVLLAIGTIGLLVSEFAFDWGRAATLTFAILNVVGLAALACAFRGMKR